METSPVISFVLPAYKPQYLEQAIRSIISQTYEAWELVVVDDCSPYDLHSIVNSFHDSRIRYYRNSSNIGGKNLVRQWNLSSSYATGEWLVLASDDDIYGNSFCSEIIRLAQAHPTIDLIRSRVRLIGDAAKENWEDGLFPETANRNEFICNWVDNKAFVCIGNYAWRRSGLLKIGGFIDFPCAFYSDVATPIAMSENGVANTDQALFSFRLSDIHLSKEGNHTIERIQAVSLFYDWLGTLDSLPVNKGFIHKKCIFDYFNQSIKYVPLRQLYRHIAQCTLANHFERIKLVLRWFKYRVCGKYVR